MMLDPILDRVPNELHQLLLRKAVSLLGDSNQSNADSVSHASAVHIERIDEDIQHRSVAIHNAGQFILVGVGRNSPVLPGFPSSLIQRIQNAGDPIPVDPANLASNPLLDEPIASRGVAQDP
jgi:hypothetical protein